jgi:hypothetical protein
MDNRRKNQRSRRADVTPEWVDRHVNALFSALTHDLGRPFRAGQRNVRSIVREWCPLAHEVLEPDVPSFKRSYLPAHFFDRYFYSSETGSKLTLESEAWDQFQKNLGRGYIFNQWKMLLLPYGRLNSILESAAREIGSILGEFDSEAWFELCEHGPNASVGVQKVDAFLDAKTKTLTGSLHCHDLLKDYLSWNTNLRDYFDRIFPNGLPLEVVEWNRLSFVPKKFDKLRTMMVEPVLNQFFQQGLGRYIAQRLVRQGNVDLSTQPHCHQLMCKTITKHGLPFATIDWSQASDRIWLGLVKRLLPGDWFFAIETVRSSSCRYTAPDGTVSFRDLTMAGSMGCGFTFPLQTLLYLCLLRALARESGHEEFVSVFGDDCIVDSDLIPEVSWLANELDWKLNLDKSFWEGGFRESCGVDAYHGVDVRPFFIERPDGDGRLDIAAWAYGCYNRVARAVLPHFYPFEIGRWLLAILNELNLPVYYVPPRYSESCGVQLQDLAQPIVGSSVRVYGSNADGWRFRYLSMKTQKVEVDPEPYYLWRLAGKGVPRSFSKAVLSLDGLPEPDLWPDEKSRVPGKGKVTVKAKDGYVHTWAYPYDQVID